MIYTDKIIQIYTDKIRMIYTDKRILFYSGLTYQSSVLTIPCQEIDIKSLIKIIQFTGIILKSERKNDVFLNLRYRITHNTCLYCRNKAYLYIFYTRFTVFLPIVSSKKFKIKFIL
jgi:hypothetical protein